MIPFGTILGPTLGSALLKLHIANGVRFELGHRIASITKNSVVLDSGMVIDADVVLLGVGVSPDLSIAQTAGVVIDRGVSVNEYLETSVPGIYAAGDIARYPDRRTGERLRIEHWVVAQRQGQVAALNILGEKTPFTAVPFFWTAQYDTTVSYVGHGVNYTRIHVDGSPEAGDFEARFVNEKTLLAYVSVGRDQASLEAELELEPAS
jgi:3-phenylpropionate/trans-cinnamate dioxygenase ferredoxin reductase subunit